MVPLGNVLVCESRLLGSAGSEQSVRYRGQAAKVMDRASLLPNQAIHTRYGIPSVVWVDTCMGPTVQRYTTSRV
jgi:hypothetical protein